jgi:sodium transport system permease protein
VTVTAVTPALAARRRRGWWRRVTVVAGKELVDHFRDRRSLVLALLYPLLGPFLLGGSLYVAGNILTADSEVQALRLPALGIEHAPAFVDYLAEREIELVPAARSPAAMVREGEAPISFEIPPQAAAQDRFTLRIYVDFANLDNLQVSSQVANIIADYNRHRAEEMAHAAGLREDFLVTVDIDQISVSRPPNMAVFLYNLMPPLILFMIFLAGVHVSIDMTAGERERGSLEPLLITPVERSAVLLAKAIVGFLMTALNMAVNLAGFRVLLWLAAAAHEHMSAPPEVGTFVAIYLIALPLMALAVALQVAIALISRSMKEAQIYLGLLPLVPALPGMILVFSPLRPSDALAAVPLLGQLTLFNQLVAGEPVALLHVLLGVATTTALTALVFWHAAHLFQREKLLFGA